MKEFAEDFERVLKKDGKKEGFKRPRISRDHSDDMIISEQAHKLNYFLGNPELSVQGSLSPNQWRLSQVPRHRRGMSDSNQYLTLIDNRKLTAPNLLTLDMPFTRLEANPKAVKDQLKSIIANPFIVGKKGSKPYIELEDATFHTTLTQFPLERQRHRK